VPESVEAMGVFLYRAERFPEEWVRARVLIRGRYVDPTLTYRAGRWWLFVGEPENDVLRLFSAPSLADRFVEHPDSPLVLGTRASARPGGRVLSFDGRLFRCAQDGGRVYGERVRVFEIVRLDPERYEEVEVSGTLGPTGSGWNAAGMHHLDALEIEPGRWLAVADGWSRWRLSFGSP
ncbi:MAG: hypothetical protein PHV11_08090, partial [Candidatus Bipolaricaulis sp.]|nr:hypothetical protein [Candidatus Bipolaricaulis sp.]